MDPYLIPSQAMQKGRETEILMYLTDQLDRALNLRGDVEDEWQQIRKQFDITFLKEKKNFPFEGASHFVVPLIATYTAHVIAKIENTIWAPSDPFTVAAKRPEITAHTRELRAFVNHLAMNVMGLREHLEPWMIDFVLLGTGITKTFYSEVDKFILEYDESTEEFLERSISVHNGPKTIHVPLDDFLFPPGTRSIQDATWKAHRVRISRNELLRRRATGRYPADKVEQILAHSKPHETEHEQMVLTEETAPYEAEDLDEFELFECWFQYPLSDREAPQDLVWVIEKDAGVVLKPQYGWFPLGMDPFDVEAFERRPKRVYGTGVGKMALTAQVELSTLRNQTVDSNTLSNTTMMKRLDTSLVPDNVRVKPGGVLTVGAMDEIEPFQLGNPFNTTGAEEQAILSVVQQRVGIQEYFGGDQGNQGQSNAVLAIMAERTRRFDLIISRVRRHLGKVMRKSLLLEQQHGPERRAINLLGEKGMPVVQLMAIPQDWLRDGIAVEVTATTSTTSKELNRQNMLSFFGLSTQYNGQISTYYQQAFMALGQGLPPELAAVFFLAAENLTTIYEGIAADYDIPQAQEFGINIADLRQAAAQLGLVAQQQAAAGGPGIPPGAGGAAGQVGPGGGGTPQGGGPPQAGAA